MMHQARQIPFALLALAFLAVPAVADIAPSGPRPVMSGPGSSAAPAPRGTSRRATGGTQRVMDGFDAATGKGRVLAQGAPGGPGGSGGPGRSDYGDIMDDVDAVIDAMRTDDGGSAKATGDFATGAAPDAAPGAPAPANTSGDPASDAASAPAAAATATPAARTRQGPHARSPVVVELFTAQGCAACPPAEDLLADLAARDDVLALSWHVDYWDYLGWADAYARPEFSLRQKGYNLNWGARSLFTPQIVVGGETPITYLRPADIAMAIDREQAEGDHVAITRRESGPRREIELTPQKALPPPSSSS